MCGTAEAQTICSQPFFWDANTEPDLREYIIFWGSASGIYTNSKSVALATTTTLNLSAGTWFVAVKAVNEAGVRSNYSNEVRVECVAGTPTKRPPVRITGVVVVIVVPPA